MFSSFIPTLSMFLHFTTTHQAHEGHVLNHQNLHPRQTQSGTESANPIDTQVPPSSVETDLHDYIPDSNTQFLSVSGTSTVWLPQNTDAISTTTIRVTSDGQVETTVATASVALYTAPNGELNYLVSPALREEMEFIAETLCSEPEGLDKRDETFCGFPAENLGGDKFFRANHLLHRLILDKFLEAGLQIPAPNASLGLTPGKIAFMMTDNTIGSLRDEVRAPLNGKVPTDKIRDLDDGCPQNIDCWVCGGEVAAVCISPHYGCPCNSKCPSEEDKPACKHDLCQSRNDRTCSLGPFKGCACRKSDDCPPFDRSPRCLDEVCDSLDNKFCYSDDYIGCRCRPDANPIVDTQPNITWLLAQQQVLSLMDEDPSECGDGSFKNETTTWTFKLNKLANTGFLTLQLSEHPELSTPGTQWRFANPQGIIRDWWVYADEQSTPPIPLDTSSTDYITVEIQPNTTWISVVYVTKEDSHDCDIDVIIVSDGAANSECGGSFPALPSPAPVTRCGPEPLQEPSFYVSEYYVINVVDRPGQHEFGVTVMGRNNRTACDQFRNYLSYSADVSKADTLPDLEVEDIAARHVPWRNFLPKMSSFTLQGAPSGQICGLQNQNFHFTNISFNQFSFSDRGEGGPVTGYCQIVYPWIVLSGGVDKPNAVCGLENGERANGWMTWQTIGLFGCWQPGNDGYCRDYGSS